MRVLYLITLAETGGAQVHVAELMRGFSGHLDLTLATGEEGFLTDVASGLGIPHRVLPSLVHPIRPAQDARAVMQVVRLIREIRPHVVHCHTSKAGIIGRLAAGLTGAPVVFTAHAWCFTEGTSWKWKLFGLPAERIAASWTKQIITVSDANRKLALTRRIAKPRRICTIHNGMPDTDLRARPEAPGVTRLIMVARCAPPKDHSLLLRALAGIAAPWHLEIVGDGPTRSQTEAEVNSLGLGSRVAFLGTREDIPELLARSHVLTLITRYEGFPLSVLEGMRAGLPVVASAVGGITEAVVGDETGILVARGDEENLRRALEKVICNPALRAKLGHSGRRRYEQHFMLGQMLDKTYHVYANAALKPVLLPQFQDRPTQTQRRAAGGTGL